jgi:hypothetical protein
LLLGEFQRIIFYDTSKLYRIQNLPVLTALGRLRQDECKFKANLELGVGVFLLPHRDGGNTLVCFLYSSPFLCVVLGF